MLKVAFISDKQKFMFQVDLPEVELMKYKNKMNYIEFYKSRMEELRKDNRILLETKDLLEEELAESRRRCDLILEFENDIIKYKDEFERLQQNGTIARGKINDLVKENKALNLSQKTRFSESQVSKYC